MDSRKKHSEKVLSALLPEVDARTIVSPSQKAPVRCPRASFSHAGMHFFFFFYPTRAYTRNPWLRTTLHTKLFTFQCPENWPKRGKNSSLLHAAKLLLLRMFSIKMLFPRELKRAPTLINDALHVARSIFYEVLSIFPWKFRRENSDDRRQAIMSHFVHFCHSVASRCSRAI